jgi:hypothetical protein
MAFAIDLVQDEGFVKLGCGEGEGTYDGYLDGSPRVQRIESTAVTYLGGTKVSSPRPV